jgi:hypothetical protein
MPEVPGDRLAQPAIVRLDWMPTEFGPDFAGIDRVATIVPWTIRDMRNQL